MRGVEERIFFQWRNFRFCKGGGEYFSSGVISCFVRASSQNEYIFGREYFSSGVISYIVTGGGGNIYSSFVISVFGRGGIEYFSSGVISYFVRGRSGGRIFFQCSAVLSFLFGGGENIFPVASFQTLARGRGRVFFQWRHLIFCERAEGWENNFPVQYRPFIFC